MLSAFGVDHSDINKGLFSRKKKTPPVPGKDYKTYYGKDAHETVNMILADAGEKPIPRADYDKWQKERSVAKRAAWKTIDQRQDEVRRDRRWKRRGLQAAGAAGATGAGLAMKPGAVQDVKDLGEKAKGIKAMHGIKAMDTKTSLNALRGAMFHHKVGSGLLGLGVATGAGLAVAGAARGAEAYHQKGVNDRRKANHVKAQQKQKTTLVKSAFGIEH